MSGPGSANPLRRVIEPQLRSSEGSHCDRCERSFRARLTNCPACRGETRTITCYARFRIERVAFIGTFAPLLALVAYCCTGDPQSMGVVLCVPLYYLLAWALVKLGDERLGSLVQYYDERTLPPREQLGLTWRGYLMEYPRFIGIVLGLFLSIAALALGGFLGAGLTDTVASPTGSGQGGAAES